MYTYVCLHVAQSALLTERQTRNINTQMKHENKKGKNTLDRLFSTS